MSHEPIDDFAPGRERVADAAAVVPVIDIARSYLAIRPHGARSSPR
jgi:hypothetical protein